MAMRRGRLYIGAGLGGVMAATATLTTHWEGVKTTIYRDVIGKETFCIGETDLSKYRPNMTIEDCRKLLVERLWDYEIPLQKAVGRAMPPSVHVAMLDASYNLGNRAMARSSMMKHLQRGEWREACAALSLYTMAAGKVIKGLVNRRGDPVWGERTICEQDLAP